MSNLPFVIQLAWVPVVALLFRLLGPKRAVLVAVFGGYLFLPYLEANNLIPASMVGTIGKAKPQGFGLIPVTKLSTTGLGLLLGLLIFDRASLRRYRLHWLDAAMVAFVGLPIVSLMVNRFDQWDSSVNQVFDHLLSWASPYFLGRIYFGNGDGVRRISNAVVIGGLLYVPLCLFEGVMGPQWYLAKRLYGQTPHLWMVERLGGSRPEVFLTQGIEVATWMALATVTAFWLGFCREAWAPWDRRIPRWAPAGVLLLTTAFCRGVYGYIDLATGLVVAILIQVFKSRWPLVALLLVAPAYVYSRISERWDGHQLVAMAGALGRSGTVEYRLRAESEYLAKVKAHDMTWGFGGTNSGIFDWWAKRQIWADGWWVHVVRDGGVVGLSAFFVAMFLLPAGAVALGLPSRTIRGSPISPAWGLTLFLGLVLIDLLHNRPFIGPIGLIGGSLVGLVLLGMSAPKTAGSGGGAAASSVTEEAGKWFSTHQGRSMNRRDLARDVSRFVAMLFLLATPELIGLLTGPNSTLPDSLPKPISLPPDESPTKPDNLSNLPDDDLTRRLKEWSKTQTPPKSTSSPRR